MRIIGHRHVVGSKNVTIEADSPHFNSVTKRLLSNSNSILIKCPTCGSVIDFNTGVNWQGPDTFSCSGCNRYLSMNLVHRALRDLGVE